MLWRVDTRRPLLFFPELHSFRNECLGYSRMAGAAAQTLFRTLPSDHWSAIFQFACAQRRWQEIVCKCGAGPRRTRPLRPQIQAIRTISWGHFSGRTGFLARRQVGHLCFLSRQDSLAQSRGRQRSLATNLPAGFSRPAPLVSRRHPDRLCGYPARPALSDVCDLCSRVVRPRECSRKTFAR